MLKINSVVNGRKVIEVKRVKSLYLSRLLLQIKQLQAEGWEIDETSFRQPIGLIQGNMVLFEQCEGEVVINPNKGEGEDAPVDETPVETPEGESETPVDAPVEPTEDAPTDAPAETLEAETNVEPEPEAEVKPEAPAKKTRSTKAKASE